MKVEVLALDLAFVLSQNSEENSQVELWNGALCIPFVLVPPLFFVKVEAVAPVVEVADRVAVARGPLQTANGVFLVPAFESQVFLKSQSQDRLVSLPGKTNRLTRGTRIAPK